jgi:hypothetical protein
MKKQQKNILNNLNRQIQLSLPYYGTTTKNYGYLLFPNPNSYKSNKCLNSKVPINTHYFGKIYYPLAYIDKKYNNKINYGNFNAGIGQCFVNSTIPKYTKKR